MAFQISRFALVAATSTGVALQPAQAASVSNAGVAAPLAPHMAAYNRHDAKALAASFAADATLFIGNGAAAVKGRDAIEKFYADFFSKNRVKSRVTTRSIYGNYIVDTERLRFNGHDLCCVASVYEMREGQIQALRFYMADKVLAELTGS